MHDITKNTLRHWAINMALFLALIYLLILGSRLNWIFDLLSHFRLQLAIGCFTFLLLNLYFKNKKSSVLLALVLCASLIDIFRYADFKKTSSELGFKIVQYNHLYTNSNLSEIQNWIEKNHQDFDVIILQEAVPETLAMSQKISELYPYRMAEIRDDAFGMVLLSKYKFIKNDTLPVEGPLFQNYLFRVEIDTPQLGNVVIFAMHALPPMNNAAQKQRNDELNNASKIIADDKSETKIFAGDWNITPYSPYFKDVLETTNLQHSFKNFNIGTSWPAPFKVPFLQIPIDQVIFSKNLQLVSRKTAPAMGSDHKPLIVSLSKSD